jgi:quercetin dioxygenase-like cupin family protein
MTHLRRYDSTQMDWQPHPTAQSIRTKIFEGRMSDTGYDTILVQLAPGQWIDWHRHPESFETVYIIQGSGKVFEADDEAQQTNAAGLDLAPGVVVTIPVGLRHAATNTGDQMLLILAFHAPATL